MAFKYEPEKVCQKLRCKEMLIHVDNPDAGEGEESLFDPYDAVSFWCECTHKGRGPDGERVHIECCSVGTSRRCFVGIDSLV